MEHASNRSTPPGFPSGKEFIKSLFARAASMHMTVFRFFLTGDDSTIHLLNNPSSPSEEGYSALDFLLDEASKAGIKLSLVFTSPWKNTGVPKFANWCGTGGYTENDLDRVQRPYDWLMSSSCRDQFKSFISMTVNRRNRINNKKYSEDDAIFSFQIANELRCYDCPPEVLTNWYHDMAAHIKSLDPNHMVATGAEGFHAGSSRYNSANPASNDWGGRTGQDFYSLHTSKDIDYATSHAWVDNWSVGDEIQFLNNWISTHESICQALGKPLVLEEFGKESYPNASEIQQRRDPIFDFVFSQVDQRVARGGGGGNDLRAAMVWEWSGYERPNMLGNWLDEGDTTFTNIIIPHGARLKSVAAGAPVAGCVPTSSLPTFTNQVIAFNGTIEAAGNRKLLWNGVGDFLNDHA
jgi:mannan endo-1,4-beta-mannosidase